MKRRKGASGGVRIQEKRKPHYPLSRAQELIRNRQYTVTLTALTTALESFPGLTDDWDIANCILLLEGSDFYKSMTSLHDHSLWQDVYRRRIFGQDAYIKIQIVSTPDERTVVISFKLREE